MRSPGCAGWPAAGSAALRRRLAAVHGVLRARWLRSLQLRVVTTTLVISAVVVTVLGFFLMQQITSDQLQAKELQAGNVVDNGLITAEDRGRAWTRVPAAAPQDLMGAIVGKLQAPAEAESAYGVAIMLAAGYSGPPVYRLGRDRRRRAQPRSRPGWSARWTRCRRRASARRASRSPA